MNLLRSLGGPLLLIGGGLLVSFIGLGADFYVHEIERNISEVESIFAPVHIPIFAGMVAVGMGYMWAVGRVSAEIRSSGAKGA